MQISLPGLSLPLPSHLGDTSQLQPATTGGRNWGGGRCILPCPALHTTKRRGTSRPPHPRQRRKASQVKVVVMGITRSMQALHQHDSGEKNPPSHLSLVPTHCTSNARICRAPISNACLHQHANPFPITQGSLY